MGKRVSIWVAGTNDALVLNFGGAAEWQKHTDEILRLVVSGVKDPDSIIEKVEVYDPETDGTETHTRFHFGRGDKRW